MKLVGYLILLFLIILFAGCSPTREASSKERAGIMLLKPEEFTRNKPYKPSKLKQKIHKKAKKSLLKELIQNKIDKIKIEKRNYLVYLDKLVKDNNDYILNSRYWCQRQNIYH